MPPSKKTAAPSNEIKNYYDSLPAHLRSTCPNPDIKNTGITLPARMIVVGASGSGKTVSLFSFLERSPKSFSKIVLCLKSADEPLYQHLIETTDPEILDVYENGEIPSLEKYKGNQGHALFIADDLMALSEKQQLPIVEWGIRCRKLGEHGFSFIYLTQSFFAVPRKIRLQVDHLIIKKLASMKDLNMILNDCSLGISKEQLYSYYKAATAKKFDFLTIALNAEDEQKYRRNFLEYL